MQIFTSIAYARIASIEKKLFPAGDFNNGSPYFDVMNLAVM